MAKPRLQAVLFGPPNRIGPTNVPALSWQGSRRPHHARPLSRAPHHVTRPELTPADDQHHFAVLGDDWWATETAWFSFHAPERGLGGWFYTLLRPNIGTVAGGCQCVG